METKDLDKLLAELQKDPEALKAFVLESESQKELLTEATQELEAEAPVNKGKVVKYGGKEYLVEIPTFKLPGHGSRIFTAKDLEVKKNDMVKVKARNEKGKVEDIPAMDYLISKNAIVKPVTK